MSDNILGKPQPHSDVVNTQPKTLLIGYGWVGQFVHKYFTEADIWTLSKGHVDKNGHPLNTDCRYEVAFVSVPTPMDTDGSCDVSIVEQSMARWANRVDLFIIRSTVAPGTTKRLTAKYNVDVVMQPEYVGETLGHPLIEPARDPFIILGGTKKATEKAARIWSKVLHANCRIRQVDGLTAEYCKYMENCFLATKVIFCNDWARLCKASGVDYMTLREAWLDDPRVGRSHTMVYEDNPGFSGKCLPKDLNAIAYYARHIIGQPLRLVEALIDINVEMRKNIQTNVPLKPFKAPNDNHYNSPNNDNKDIMVGNG